MLGFVSAFVVELATHESVVQQITTRGGAFNVMALAFTVSTGGKILSSLTIACKPSPASAQEKRLQITVIRNQF